MCWTLKGQRQAIFAGKLKESCIFQGLHLQHLDWELGMRNEHDPQHTYSVEEKNHSRSQIRRNFLMMENVL